MSLVAKLTYLMNKKDIKSIAQLAKLSNIPYTTLIDIFNEKSVDIKISTSKKLCHFFQVTLDELFNDKIDLINKKNNGV